MKDAKCDTCGDWFSTESKDYPPVCGSCNKPAVKKTTKKSTKKVKKEDDDE